MPVASRTRCRSPPLSVSAGPIERQVIGADAIEKREPAQDFRHDRLAPPAAGRPQTSARERI